MKTGIKILIGSLLYVLGVTSIFAATVDHFNVSLVSNEARANEARVGETLDLKVEAVDKNGATVTNYQGTVLIFSDSDPKATFSIVLKDNTYTFKSSDLGQAKIENAVKFSQAGIQNIYVYDLNNDLVFGVAKATVKQEEVKKQIDHFNVSLWPNEARVGESLDLKVEAVDKNGATVTNYQGTVLIFSDSDPKATLPIVLEENTYTFKSSDLGQAKFENAVKFSQAGIQNIYVYDFNDDLVFGIAKAAVKQEEVKKQAELQAQTDYEDQIKANAEKAFGQIKELLNKETQSQRIIIFKGLVAILEVYKTKSTGDTLKTINYLITLINDALN